MPASLRRPSPLTGLSDRLNRITRPGPNGAPAWLPAALTLSGVAVAALVVWHFVNPAQFALDDWLAIAGALASAGVIGVGVFQWTGHTGHTSRRPRPQPAEPPVSEDMVREMTEQLRQGRAVSWAGPVYLLPAGIQASGRVYPWGRIDLGRTATDGRQFHIHLRDTEAPIVSLPTAATRFAAGRRVFEAFASGAAGGTTAAAAAERRAA
jgi:hypothetical protein